MVTYILNLVDTNDLNKNAYWGDRENTTMHLVSALGYNDLALQLAEKGVHANVPNSRGLLPHQVAQTETMVDLLLNIKDNKILSHQISVDSSYSPSTLYGMNNAQYRLQQSLPQQQQQLVKPTSSSPSHNMDQPLILSSSSSTLRKCGKDDHYFRSGQVEQTKQKVLGDEQLELEKQRERRRKDIALLAQRSAVKNNPFVKKSEPALAPIHSGHFSSSSTHADSTPNSAVLRIRANEIIPGERKCKRNSKGINSLQKKSYVSSSIFRQGQPSLGDKKQCNLTHQQNARQRLKKASIDIFNATDTNPHDDDPDFENSNNPVSEPSSDAMDQLDLSTMESTSDKLTALEATSTTPLTIDDDSDNDSDNDSKSDQSTTSSALSSADHGLQDSDSSVTVSENNDQSSARDTSILKPLILPSLTSPSKIAPPKLLSTPTIVEQSSKIQLETKSSKLTRNNLLIRDYGVDTRRQSGSQKSHWSKELTSWVTILNREFSLNVDDDDNDDDNHQAHGSTTSIDDLTLALENASRFGDVEIGITPLDNAKYEDAHRDEYQQQSNSGTDGINYNNANGTDEIDQQGIDDGLTIYSDKQDENECRRPRMDITPSKDLEHSPKTYGSISARRPAAIYAKKAPTFDSIYMPSGNDNGDYSTGNTNICAANENTISALSQSVSTPTSLSPNAADHHHQQNHAPSSSSSSSTTTTAPSTSLCNRGKLYVRVNAVNDILLPLPRDRAYVRCVIGDGRYEYMSRYEPLGQNIDLGFECIIDSHPDMIITLSLHVRPDYMLKKPLKRLFTSNRKRKGSLSAYVSNEDGAVGQTRFAVGDMLGACYKRPYSGCFYCFNAWHIHSTKDKTTSSISSSVTSSSTSSTSSSSTSSQELDQGVLKVIGNFKVQLLYLPVLNPSSVRKKGKKKLILY
ncbi:unnamed protein product [Absidia cylindrospora]